MHVCVASLLRSIRDGAVAMKWRGSIKGDSDCYARFGGALGSLIKSTRQKRVLLTSVTEIVARAGTSTTHHRL